MAKKREQKNTITPTYNDSQLQPIFLCILVPRDRKGSYYIYFFASS